MSTPSDWDYVEFDIKKEGWTIFDLADGTHLKSRYVLGAVLKKKNTIGQYGVNHNIYTVAIVPKKYWVLLTQKSTHSKN